MFLPAISYIYFMKKTLSIIASGLLLAGCGSGSESPEKESASTVTPTSPERPTADWESLSDIEKSVDYATGSCTNADTSGDMGACGTDGGVIFYALNRPGGEDVAAQLRVIALQDDRENDEAILWGDGWTIHCADRTADYCDLINAEYPGGNLVAIPKGSGMDIQGTLDKYNSGIQDGTHLVGEEIQPGTYKYNGESSRCYWARLSGLSGSSSDILANGNEKAQAYVTIDPSDRAFESQGCGFWELISD